MPDTAPDTGPSTTRPEFSGQETAEPQMTGLERPQFMNENLKGPVESSSSNKPASTDTTGTDSGSTVVELPPFPREGRLLGVDFGTKRLGFAVCNSEQTIASPIENYTRQNAAVDAKCVKRLVSEYRIAGLVVGLPVHMSGDESPKSRESRVFGKWLHELTGLPVTFADERYSSLFAEQCLMSVSYSKKKRQTRLDMLAAQVILQGYIDGRRTAQPGSLSD
jgi:putative Holliday junction resolvase